MVILNLYAHHKYSISYILFTKLGSPLLADFGSSRFETGLTRSQIPNTFVATVHYTVCELLNVGVTQAFHQKHQKYRPLNDNIGETMSVMSRNVLARTLGSRIRKGTSRACKGQAPNSFLTRWEWTPSISGRGVSECRRRNIGVSQRNNIWIPNLRFVLQF